MRGLARGGFAANGVVHALIGAIIFVIAFGGRAEGDQTGAFKAIATAPLGFVALWVMATLLAGLGVWHGLEGVLARGRPDDVKSTAKKWGRRVSQWGQTAVYLALAVVSASVALGARPNSTKTARGASHAALLLPGGPIVLGLVGCVVTAIGIGFVVRGIRRGFRTQLALPSGPLGTGIVALGAVGYIAKGVALATVGVLLVIAAVRVDPGAAGGLDTAITALIALPFGPWLAGIVGIGFVAYGLFCLFRARYARL
ncbi:hypothetical protein GCM10022240_17710 [Microbacterium kribbense]|uniref:DUF1206 domain-containing protein n=1 Tax=Microbacterium kribbense TaxID=433645 RepID=A0ABP7GP59_9MICO